MNTMIIKNYYIKHKDKIIKIFISSLIITFLLNFVDYSLLFNTIERVNYLFVFAVLLIPISIFFRAWRWMIILNKEKKLCNTKESCKLTLVGVALNIFLPASFGDLAKSYYGYRWHGIKEEMISSSIVDKFMALFSIFVLGSFVALIMQIFELAIFSIIMSCLLFILFFFPKIVPWKSINNIILRITKIKLDEKKLSSSFKLSNKIKLITLTISLLAWMITYFQLYIVCLSFQIDINFTFILAVAPLITLAVLFPLTLNGIGSGELMMVYLFSLVNVAPTLAILVSFLYSQVLTTIIPGIFGLGIIIKQK